METTLNNPSARLYRLVSQHANDQVAAEAVNILEENIKKEVAEQTKPLATREDLLKVKVDLIKWIFGFFIVVIGMIIGLYFKK